MTPAEWDAFELELLATFRAPREGLDEAQRLVLRGMFQRVPLEAGRRAIRRLVENGQVFVPVPGELYGALKHVAAGSHQLRTWLDGTQDEQAMLDRWRGRPGGLHQIGRGSA